MDETPYINKSAGPMETTGDHEAIVVPAYELRGNPDGTSPEIVDNTGAAMKQQREVDTGEEDKTLPGPVHSAFGDIHSGDVGQVLEGEVKTTINKSDEGRPFKQEAVDQK